MLFHIPPLLVASLRAFGVAPSELYLIRHCEAFAEAIQCFPSPLLDCFVASLRAMTENKKQGDVLAFI
jgi:hypothetical protein